MKLVAQTDLDRDWQFQGNIRYNESHIIYRYIDMIGNYNTFVNKKFVLLDN